MKMTAYVLVAATTLMLAVTSPPEASDRRYGHRHWQYHHRHYHPWYGRPALPGWRHVPPRTYWRGYPSPSYRPYVPAPWPGLWHRPGRPW
jgi:hypothetical protein